MELREVGGERDGRRSAGYFFAAGMVGWKGAHALHPNDPANREEWVADRSLRGKARGVPAGLRRSETRQKLEGQGRKTGRNGRQTPSRQREAMRYDEALAAGFPIATGAIGNPAAALRKTAWTRRAPGGEWNAPRRSSNCARRRPAAAWISAWNSIFNVKKSGTTLFLGVKKFNFCVYSIEPHPIGNRRGAFFHFRPAGRPSVQEDCGILSIARTRSTTGGCE